EVVGPRSVPVGQQRRGEGGEGLAEGVGGLAGAGEEGDGLGVEGGVAAAGGAEVGRAGVGLAGEGLLEEGVEAAPAVGGEVVHGGGGYPRIAAPGPFPSRAPRPAVASSRIAR